MSAILFGKSLIELFDERATSIQMIRRA